MLAPLGQGVLSVVVLHPNSHRLDSGSLKPGKYHLCPLPGRTTAICPSSTGPRGHHDPPSPGLPLMEGLQEPGHGIDWSAELLSIWAMLGNPRSMRFEKRLEGKGIIKHSSSTRINKGARRH